MASRLARLICIVVTSLAAGSGLRGGAGFGRASVTHTNAGGLPSGHPQYHGGVLLRLRRRVRQRQCADGLLLANRWAGMARHLAARAMWSRLSSNAASPNNW